MRRTWRTWLLVALASGGVAWGTLVLPPTARAGEQVTRGKELYQEHCARCHGDRGEGKLGRALIGPDAGLGGYGTAQGLFEYVSKVMPIDRPGRLFEDEYWAVLAFILNQNRLLPPGTPLGRDNAAAIRISH